MAIRFDLQFFVENERNDKYQWLAYGLVIASLLSYGILFHWIPTFLRMKRSENSVRFKPYFKFIKLWETFNRDFQIKLPLFGYIYIQPSLFLIYFIYLLIMVGFSVCQVYDIDYQPRMYIIAKRLSKISLANLPLIYILIIKNDLLTSITGLKHDKLVLLHKWFSRTFFAMIVVHIVLSSKYWLDLGFPIMLVIPPQIFGYIAFACFFFLNFASLKFIRRWAYDFFLVQHRVFSFIMLLFIFFHNRKNTESAVILAVHQLVIDRILSRILSFVHARMSPTRGRSTFEILDEDTLLVTVPIKAFPFHERKWWQVPLPKVNTWKPGQHVYLNVGKVSRFQQHPFTIASLSESGEMKFVIRVQKGFTKNLMKKVVKMKQEKEEREIQSEDNNSSRNSTFSADVETGLLAVSTKPKGAISNGKDNEEIEITREASSVDNDEDLENNKEDDDEDKLKAVFVGPVGAHYQPIITFDSVLFFSAGSGASFTFPVCLDLLKTIRTRNLQGDFFNRNSQPIISIVWSIKKLANVHWYDFVLDELSHFCQLGLLHIDIYVTQESEKSLEKLNYRSVVEGSSNTQDQSFSEQRSFEKFGESSTMDSGTHLTIFDAPNVFFHSGRPELEATINTHVDFLKSKDTYKSLAIMSCGPKVFNHTIKSASHEHRWDINAPDIYCYTESF